MKKAVGKSTAFLLTLRKNTFIYARIFSKRLVKTYPQSKIKKRGTAFEQMDGY